LDENWGEFLKQSCIVVMQNQLLHDTQVKPLYQPIGKHYYCTCNSSISGFGESVVGLQVTNDAEPALRPSRGAEAFRFAP